MNHNVGNEIEVLTSNLCDYNDAYILSSVAVVGVYATQVAFKNCSPFIKCIPKIDGKTTDYVEDLDLVIPMCKLL